MAPKARARNLAATCTPTHPVSHSAGPTFEWRAPNRSWRRKCSSSQVAGKALRRVVLVEGDQYYREVLTVELLRQGFVVDAFADGASLLGALATAVDADLVVLDWDLPGMSGIKVMAELRRQDVNLPVVLLTGKVIAGDENDRCLLAPWEALDAYECMAFDQGAVDSFPSPATGKSSSGG
jgi:CheY-like chemotaxis protein